MFKKVIFCLIFSFLIFGTQSLASQNKTNASKSIKSLIAKKRSYNRSYGFGYRIQIYYGTEVRAKSLLSKFKISYPKTYTKLDYEQPNWKVQVGNYKTKLEADRAVLLFSEKFSGLMVIPMGK